jgi:7-carboxy-7-deazaguanine synthase
MTTLEQIPEEGAELRTLIPIIEVFGPTIQGEGILIGQPTFFVRTAGCSYTCSWCDTKYSWDGTVRPTQYSPSALYEELKECAGKVPIQHVTISGGNPALIRQPMQEFIKILKSYGIAVGVETQGDIDRDWFSLVNQLTLSPKPPSAKVRREVDVLFQILRKHADRANIKIVVFDEKDYEWAIQVFRRVEPYFCPMFVQVGNEWLTETDPDVHVHELLSSLAWLADKVAKETRVRGVRVLPQMHTLLWGNQRGV